VALLVGAVLVFGSVAAADTRSADQQQAASNYIEKAVLPAINGPACVREHAPATSPGAPPTALTAILGVLRGPAAPADPRTAPILRGLVGVYIHYVRLARTAFGEPWFVFVAEGNQGFLPPADENRCLQQETANFNRELPTIPKVLRGLTKKMFARQLAAERRIDARPLQPGVWLSTTRGGGGGGNATLSEQVTRIEQGQWVGTGGPGIPGDPHSGTVQMIVPDGVATATIHYPAGPANGFQPKIISPAVTVTDTAVGNVLLFNVPRSSGGGQITKPTTMVWHAADGRVIKTFHGRL